MEELGANFPTACDGSQSILRFVSHSCSEYSYDWGPSTYIIHGFLYWLTFFSSCSILPTPSLPNRLLNTNRLPQIDFKMDFCTKIDSYTQVTFHRIYEEQRSFFLRTDLLKQWISDTNYNNENFIVALLVLRLGLDRESHHQVSFWEPVYNIFGHSISSHRRAIYFF